MKHLQLQMENDNDGQSGCIRDYTAQCPYGWKKDGVGCIPPFQNTGTCSRWRDWSNMSIEQKKTWETHCGGHYPCEHHTHCLKDWSSPCPVGWYLSDRHGTCEAGEYDGPCPETLHGVSGLSAESKAILSSTCGVTWPCVGEDPDSVYTPAHAAEPPGGIFGEAHHDPRGYMDVKSAMLLGPVGLKCVAFSCLVYMVYTSLADSAEDCEEDSCETQSSPIAANEDSCKTQRSPMATREDDCKTQSSPIASRQERRVLELCGHLMKPGRQHNAKPVHPHDFM